MVGHFDYDRKKKIQSSVGRKLAIFFVVAGNFYYDRKKKIQSSVWQVRDHYYDRKKKDTVVCLASCAFVSVFVSGQKLAIFLMWRESFITTGKKKDTVVCLLSARFW